MSYKCYKCGKILDDKASYCDRCGTNRIKVESNKIENKIVNRPNYLMYIILLVSIIFIGLAIYSFGNIELQHTFGGIAIVLNIFDIILYPRKILLKVTLFFEVYIVFSLLIIPFVFLYMLYEKVAKGWF